ncbi:hypothetical protein BANRA_04716 [Escherichia coli]|uniref:Lipoprotein n=1 Tax=Escherichia coli TaxID=562 RepID=A0A0G3B3M8_ECOLX|nr:hypothetical protein pCMY42_EC8_00012 [Escherichia coli]QDB00914.1 hypothetical protein [Escherichia coli]VCY90535.1 hypothetical protein BANRA_04716 [Escherichia coli]
MNRIIPAGCLAALFLAGCNSPSQHTPVPRNYGAASDVAVNGGWVRQCDGATCR